ncbi:MAG: ABC transporter substrate-binding protein [Trueperaceae bacterium]|nr:ABC transporter substrate-binding protein [Trueperaceae bacterium]
MVVRLVLASLLFGFLPVALAQDTCASVGGTATIAQWSEPGNLNPLIFPTTYDTNVQELVFARLIRPTADLTFEPDLAESWTVSDDARTLTFTLREGLTFHDGAPVTAQDVAFTFTSMADPAYDGGRFAEISILVGAEAYREGTADAVEGIVVVDDRTISFTTTEPFAPFLPVIGGIFILPEHVYGAVPIGNWQEDASNRNPVGSGAFVFDEYRPGEFVSVSAFEGYWEGRPCLDRLIVRFGDQNTLLAALLAGEIDAAPVPIDGATSVANAAGLDLLVIDTLNFQYIGTNLRGPLLGDAAVREAIAHAVNRQAIVTGLLQGYGGLIDTVFPTNHWSYPPDVAPIAYDPAAAAEILEAAGWTLQGGVRVKDGQELSLRLFVPTGNLVRERTAPLIQANLRQIGIAVEIQTMDFPTLVTYLLPREADGTPRAVTAEDFDLFLLGFGIERDPNEYLSYLVETDMPPNGYNFIGVAEAEIAALMREGRVTLDQDARTEIYREVGRQMRDLLAWVPLYQAQDLYGANERLVGFGPDVRGINVDVARWSLR